MSIGVIAKFVIKEGKSEEFEIFFLQLTGEVRQKEPGNELYQLARSRTEANSYTVLELYGDEDALIRHRETKHFKDAGVRLGSLLARRPEIEYLDVLH